MLRSLGRINILVLGIFFILAVFITFPLIFHLTDLTTGLGDELLIAWNHNWVIHSFLLGFNGILNIFNANNYFPFVNSLAYSDAYFTNSIIALIPVLILKSPIVANNFNLILSLTLLGFFTFKLTQYITNENFISILSGILIIFSPALLAELVHIQIISVYFVPLAILLFIKFIDSGKKFFYWSFLISFLLQTFNSFMPGYFIVFTCSLILLSSYFTNKKIFKLFLDKTIIINTLLTIVLVTIIAVPYFQVSRQFNYVRDLRDTIHFALQPEDFISTNVTSKFYPFLSQVSFTKDLQNNGEVKSAFLGLTFSILSLFSLIYLIKNWKKLNYAIRGIFLSAVLGLVLSLGPFLHIHRITIHHPFPIPLPYFIFYYLIPGFQGFRNSARFEIMFIIFFAPIVGIFLKLYLAKIKHVNRRLILLILVIFVVLEFSFPLKFFSVPKVSNFPKVYSYLKTLPPSITLVHMPIYNWNAGSHANDEIFREYYSTINFNRMLNGYSGFSPPPWQNLVTSLLENFPSSESINTIKKLGINLIVVHKNEYDVLFKENYQVDNKKISSGSAIINFLLKNKSVKLIKQIDNDYIFRIK